MDYCIDRWQLKIWHSETRYYRAEIKQDLFGQWLMECQWSGLWQKGGRRTITPLNSYEEGQIAMKAIEKKRQAHGYYEVRNV